VSESEQYCGRIKVIVQKWWELYELRGSGTVLREAGGENPLLIHQFIKQSRLKGRGLAPPMNLVGWALAHYITIGRN
jgi:hypothetical protein